jgi:hypothetical protein
MVSKLTPSGTPTTVEGLQLTDILFNGPDATNLMRAHFLGRPQNKIYQVIESVQEKKKTTTKILFSGSFKKLIAYLDYHHYIIQKNKIDFKRGLALIRDEGWHLKGRPFGLNLSIEYDGPLRIETFVYDTGQPKKYNPRSFERKTPFKDYL